MPRWLARAGFMAALFAHLRFLISLGSILGLLWVLAVSALMHAGGLAGRGTYSPRSVAENPGSKCGSRAWDQETELQIQTSPLSAGSVAFLMNSSYC